MRSNSKYYYCCVFVNIFVICKIFSYLTSSLQLTSPFRYCKTRMFPSSIHHYTIQFRTLPINKIELRINQNEFHLAVSDSQCTLYSFIDTLTVTLSNLIIYKMEYFYLTDRQSDENYLNNKSQPAQEIHKPHI